MSKIDAAFEKLEVAEREYRRRFGDIPPLAKRIPVDGFPVPIPGLKCGPPDYGCPGCDEPGFGSCRPEEDESGDGE